MLWIEQSWLLLLVDVSVKSLVLALIARIVLVALRVQNANMRHRVWSAVLLAMIVLPLLVPLTPTVPLPAWMTPAFSTAIAEDPVEETTEVDLVPGELAPSSDFEVFETVEANTDDYVPGSDFVATVSKQVWTDPESTSEPDPKATEATAPKSWSRANTWLAGHWPSAIFVVYFAVVIGFFARIFAGIRGTHQVVARSIPCATSMDSYKPDVLASEGVVTDLRSSRTLTCTSRLYESNDLNVPLTVGFVNPVILLPAEWRTWSQTKLGAVLAHESAHIRRGDYLVTLLAEFNRALHWFNPLSWLLRRWLSELAEQNCDDAVIASTGERAQYARHLLEVASSLQDKKTRVAWASVAMARKPNVETRIDAILDSKRPLASRLGLLSAFLLIVTSVPAVLLAAALRPAETPPEETTELAEVQHIKDQATEPLLVAAVDEWKPIHAPGNNNNLGGPYKTESKRIKGQVLGPDGKGRWATIHVISKRTAGALRRTDERILANTPTDNEGRFDFVMDLPVRDPSVDRGIWSGRVEQIVATSAGFGPAMSNVVGIRKGEEITLQLAEDTVPIEGQILTLEGEPVRGARLEVALLQPIKDIEKHLSNLRERTKEKPNMFASFTAMAMEDFLDSKVDYSRNELLVADKMHHSGTLPETVTTDAQGRFRISGIGKHRVIALELSGPGIVKSWISVITHDMQPINASTFIGSRTNMTYGAKFTYSAEPSQIIQGTITDIDTGKRIAGVTVATEQHDAGHVVSVTDADGRYQLDGIPKKNKHSLSITPAIDSPYFQREYFELSDIADGLEPTNFNVELKKTLWVSGTVTDKATGKPIRARVVFTPHVSNEAAKSYSALSIGRYLEPHDTTKGVITDDQGRFRVRAVAGEGMLVARSVEPGYCVGIGRDALESKWFKTDSQPLINTYSTLLPEWAHALSPISVSVKGETEVDIQLDPGQSLKVKTVDATNRSISGVRVFGRVPDGLPNEAPLEHPETTILAINAKQPRVVYFYHEERNLGAAIIANQNKSGSTQVQLQTCGTLKGQLIDKDKQPMANVSVGMQPLALPGLSHPLAFAMTNQDGRFESKRVIPGLKFDLYTGYGQDKRKIGKTFNVKPNEAIDLETIQLDTKAPSPPGGVQVGLTLEEDKAPSSGEKSNGTTAALETVQTEAVASKPETNSATRPLVYEGQVLLPNGKPAPGADIYFNYWRWSPVRGMPAKPIAKTDANGRFRVARDLKDIDAESVGAHFVAKLDGYGFATAFSIALEKSGHFESKLTNDETYKKLMKPLLDRDRGPMRLLPDDSIIRGKVVDLEGRGISDASVSVIELLASVDGTSATWDKAIKNPNIDYITVSNLFRRQLRGPEVEEMIGVVKTNAEGEFQIHGLGKHRIAKLAISGRNIEASSVFALTDASKSIKLPMQSGGLPENGYQFHGNSFTHVANASRPVVGQVTDAASGAPIEGVVINSTRTWTYAAPGEKSARSGSDVAYAVTDAKGNYRLDGIPRAKYGLVRAMGVGTDFLPHQSNVDTAGTGIDPVTHDVRLDRGMVIEGRVTDAVTGKGVRGAIEFFRKGSQGRTAMMMGSEGPRMSNPDGRFKIVIPKQDGNVCFTAYARHLYPKKSLVETAEDDPNPPFEGALMDFRVLSEFHAFQSIRANDPVGNPVEWKLQPASVLTGHAIGPGGRRVTGLKYVGQADGIPRWTPSASGDLKIYGLKPNQNRRVAVMCDETKLAGFLELRNATNGFTVSLKPWATLKGRLVDEDGDALSGAQLIRGSVFGQPLAGIVGELPVNAGALEQSLPLPPIEVGLMTNHRHVADKDGRFELTGLVPGFAYGLAALYQGEPSQPFSNDIVKKLALKPGETRDLGTVVLKKPTREQIDGTIQSSPKPIVISP